MLEDFISVNIANAELEAVIESTTSNGIRIVVNDGRELRKLSLKNDSYRLPVAIDLTQTSNLDYIRNAKVLRNIEYCIINTIDVIKYIPLSVKVIYELDIKLLRDKSFINDILSDKRISLLEICFNKEANCVLEEVMSLVEDYKKNNKRVVLKGFPCRRKKYLDYTVCENTVTDRRNHFDISDNCKKCSLFVNGCRRTADKVYNMPLERINEIKTIVGQLPRVEAVVLYSGGLDSRVSVHRLIKQNSKTRLLLICFYDDLTLGVQRIKDGYIEEFSKSDQVVGLLMISLTHSGYRNYIFNSRILDISDKTDTNLTCLLCKGLFIYYSAIIGKLVGAKKIVMGNNLVHGFEKDNPPLPQKPEFIDIYKRIADGFDLRIEMPLYSISERCEIIKEARKYGIELSSSWFSGCCQYGKPKRLKYGIEFSIDFLDRFVSFLLLDTKTFDDLIQGAFRSVEFIS